MSMNNIIYYPIIDIHIHLRLDDTKKHLDIIKSAGISEVVVMANALEYYHIDNKKKIEEYRKKCEHSVIVHLTSAITHNRAGERLVNINGIKELVVGFSDDGKCLKDMDLLE